ncbi:Gfo/Idh/MocA family protein [Nocardioides bruguierae]|uniref:Gfo/Idh/MocA family oxidoreductase n=1 Tax=Nocardioides bruguierae TaxID=2945102 RepID=A0A9X2IGQ5_9ACTN|nr:Gfo/Idh/MocA family oxidoreductase [Nocardioides bruguierae]MCM0621025.1 Gfo/Idh/MocA family oxidoreductase [Nocardioides bruguierae]
MATEITPLKLGVVGYSVGGRFFHAPFVEAAEGVELAGVVTRSEARRKELAEDYPGVPVFDSLTDMLAAGVVEAVTITTPPATHRELALEAIAAGVHVLMDKPFMPTAEVAREVAQAAQDAGVVLAPFHNRRTDADVRTLAGVMEAGRLGPIWRVHSRFDLDEAHGVEGGENGGLLRDLGSHVVDQVVGLLGPVTHVLGHLDHADIPDVGRGGGLTDVSFHLTLTHASGAMSTVESTKTVHLAQRELLAYGEAGSYQSLSRDVQAQDVFAGLRPAADPEGWGYDSPENAGWLRTADGEERVPSAQGRYHDMYTAFAQAVAGTGAPVVTVEEAIHVLAILDAARVSAAEKRLVAVEQ